MLKDLEIENVAVIERARVRFAPGLNVLTGETGAGKSILIDAINAILGNRTSRDLVRSGAARACIRATFTALPPEVTRQLADAGYDAGADELLLYREISADGKGACRVNGMPATAAVMRQLSEKLLTIHGQHDSASLTNPALHLGLLDRYAQNGALYDAYHALYRELVGVIHKLDALTADEAGRRARAEELQACLDALEAAALSPGEEAALHERKRVITHAQAIVDGLRAAQAALRGEEGGDTPGAADLLGGAVEAFAESARLDPALAPQAEQFSGLYYTARELATDLADRLDAYDIDPGEQEQLDARLDLLYRLKKKYGAAEVEDLIALQKRTAAELEAVRGGEGDIEALSARKRELYAQARQAAEALTQSRLKAFAAMEREMKAALEFLNMPGIRFVLRHARGPLASAGQDKVEFLISANVGEEPKPLAKIASGGELARIMLAFKSALAERDAIATVIYDEIDTGVSGLAAGRIGQLLKKTAAGHQVLCITHTAQVAAFADEHLLIRKSAREGRTYTEISPLDMDARVRALAAMISGDKVTEISLANARELIEKSQ